MDAIAYRKLTAEDFRRRAVHVRAPHHPEEVGDHHLNPDIGELILASALRDAAVLVPVVDRPEGATMILTQRAAAMRSHSGQIAFPGGRVDPTDPTPEFTALRETHEEIGLDPEEIEVVGRMPDYLSGTGHRITPVLSVVRPDFRLSLNPDEVELAFEVPLGFLMDPANHRMGSRILNEKERRFYEMPFGERHIWGLTAGIIRTLYERLYA